MAVMSIMLRWSFPRIIPFASVALLVCAVGVAAEEKGTKYGAGVTLEQGVTVAELLAKPETHLGKTVRVDGVVMAVCQNMGCWMEIADNEQSPGIQFKVEDGVIVFPKDGKGRRASAQGTFEVAPSADEHAAEHTEEHAQAPNPSEHEKHMAEAAKATGTKYRVKATGAILY
jgi:hypothetical protein